MLLLVSSNDMEGPFHSVQMTGFCGDWGKRGSQSG